MWKFVAVSLFPLDCCLDAVRRNTENDKITGLGAVIMVSHLEQPIGFSRAMDEPFGRQRVAAIRLVRCLILPDFGRQYMVNQFTAPLP